MDIKSEDKFPMITPGNYEGYMTSNKVKFLFPDETGQIVFTEIKMNVGVKCIECKCTITVSEDGTVTTELL